MSRQYHAPLNVDLPSDLRSQIYRQRRVNAAVAHAKYAARMCATQMAVHGLVLDELDVMSRMASYQVHKPLREFATAKAFELAKEMRDKGRAR